jgi:hypothetical protein
MAAALKPQKPFKLPRPFKLAGRQWTNLSLRGSTLAIFITSVFELRYTTDREATLRMAEEHGLTGQLLKAEEESVSDETSLCSFENTRREADTTTFAVFYVKHGLLVGIELSAPPRFGRDVHEIFLVIAAC